MHLLVAHAGASSPEGAEAFAALELPNLAALLARLAAAGRDDGDEYALSMPHERALARELGWDADGDGDDDGRLPFAARAAAGHGIDPGADAWGLAIPAHWHVARDHVSLVDPDRLALDAAESQALCDAVRELFVAEGWRLVWGAPLAWYASHDSLAALPCASLDRAVGRNVDLWLGGRGDPRLGPLRRLQNEVQMLLHDHPVNEAREARGELPVNSFWLSGCGRRRPERPTLELRVVDALRAAALAGDWTAWADAWRALDAGPLADLVAAARTGGPAVLTLCGERSAARFEARKEPFWKRVARRVSPPAPAAVLKTL